MNEYQFLIEYILKRKLKSVNELSREANNSGLDGNKVVKIIQMLLEQGFVTVTPLPVNSKSLVFNFDENKTIKQLEKLESEENK